MVYAKQKMELIANPNKRMQTFNSRKKSLSKKLSEFTTLCDVPACMIIYEPTQKKHFVWPEDKPERVDDVIAKYKVIRRTYGNMVKSSGVAEFLVARKRKVEEDLCKLRKTISETKYPTSIEIYGLLNEAQLRWLGAELSRKAQVVTTRILLMKMKMKMKEEKELLEMEMLHNSANYNNNFAPMNMNMIASLSQNCYVPQPMQMAAPLTLQYYSSMDPNIPYSGNNSDPYAHFSGENEEASRDYYSLQ